jgi:hypothetical protein
VESQLGEFRLALVFSSKIRPVLEFSCESQPMMCFLAIFGQCWYFPARFEPVLVFSGVFQTGVGVFCRVFDLYLSFPACNHIAE